MKYFVLALLLSVSVSTLARTPAQVQRVDFTGFQFTNFCNGEPVVVSGGELLAVLRLDFGGDVNGVHLVNKVAGSFRAVGQFTGDDYLVNVAAPSNFLPLATSNTNPVNGAGAVSLVSNVEMINLSNPGSGLSKVKALIIFVINGNGVGENKVLEVSFECIGG